MRGRPGWIRAARESDAVPTKQQRRWKRNLLGISLVVVSGTAMHIGVRGHWDGGDGLKADRFETCAYGSWSSPVGVSDDPVSRSMQLASPVVAMQNGLYFLSLAGPALISGGSPTTSQTSLLLIEPVADP